MIPRRALVAVAALLALTFGAIGAAGVGLEVGCEIVPIDAAGAYGKAPAALAAASDAFLALLAGQGIPPSELVDVEADVDAALAEATEALADLPSFLPIPLAACGIEIPLRLGVIDAVRLSGGLVDSAWARDLALAAGALIPVPLFDETFEWGGETARFTLDGDASAWSLAADAVKRFDVWIAAVCLSAGLGYSTGGVTVDVGREVPADWAAGIDSALSALHLADLRWAALTARVGLRLELGLPFLRVYAEARLAQPLVEWIGWWDLGVAGWAGSIGVVIRF